mmetsp:Transcript_20820/g.18444  ORF Transcript_20820/g.18444 Transcript_20820/m.18444 type:complete len:85 (+) Transcript_20820:833-1087(+)
MLRSIRAIPEDNIAGIRLKPPSKESPRKKSPIKMTPTKPYNKNRILLTNNEDLKSIDERESLVIKQETSDKTVNNPLKTKEEIS